MPIKFKDIDICSTSRDVSAVKFWGKNYVILDMPHTRLQHLLISINFKSFNGMGTLFFVPDRNSSNSILYSDILENKIRLC